ncbi:MAG TPA: TRAP transporter substrate-binding protein DctP [Archangium sp.]
MRIGSPRLVAVLCLWAFTAFAADPEFTLKLATVAPEGSPWAQALQDFKKKAEAGANGKLRIKLFLGGTLGDENDTVMAVKRGQIQAFGGSTGALASQVPEFNVLELPYLFDKAEEADFVLDKIVKTDIEKACSDRGLVFGFWSENGYRSFGGKFPVTKPEDLKGRKMRSQDNPIHLLMYRTFGGSPTPIPTTEVLTALQTGTVDGYDQSALYLFAASWHTASTHYSVTNHIYQPAAIVYNKAAWDSYPPEVKAAINDAAAAVQGDLRKKVRAMVPILLENVKELGVKVNVLSKEELAPFVKLGDKARADYVKTAPKAEKALYEKMVKGLADFRSGKAK